jgi:hypothetical protein
MSTAFQREQQIVKHHVINGVALRCNKHITLSRKDVSKIYLAVCLGTILKRPLAKKTAQSL